MSNELKAISELLQHNHKSKTPDYFLFMLGTDTVFTPVPTKDSSVIAEQKTYENGESLSYVARLVAERLQEAPETPKNNSLAFYSESVAVVNGPTTLGSEVGERISKGVLQALLALANGKETIEIFAHSRGAVESILIGHELERIKKALKDNPSKTLKDILMETPCAYTRAAFARLEDVNLGAEDRNKLLTRLEGVQINMFLMDPVPGGSYKGLPGVAWRDDRFYQKPPCQSAELILFRDERTRCFIPVVPKEMSPLVLPGHHGTASGNIYSQQYQPVVDTIEKRDTATLQQLVIGKLLYFIDSKTMLLKNNKKPVDLSHAKLDSLTNEYIAIEAADEKRKHQYILALYKNVLANDLAFRYFGENTSYPYLGSERTQSGARYIHHGGRNYVGLDTLTPAMEGQFVNTEHAFLFLHEKVDFQLSTDSYHPDVLVAQMMMSLEGLFSSYENKDAQVLGLFNDLKARELSFRALSIFIDVLSQKVLRNHLSGQIKIALINQIKVLFKLLEDRRKGTEPNSPLFAVIDGILSLWKKGIKTTAESYYKSLLDQSTEIHHRVGHYLVTDEEFNKVFSGFMQKLNNAAQHDANLVKVQQVLQVINPITITTVRDAFNALKNDFRDINDQSSKTIVDLTAVFNPYFEAATLNDQDLLTDLERLYENTQSLIEGKSAIEGLIGEQPFDSVQVDTLHLHLDRIIKLAARILVKKAVDLHTIPTGMNPEFFNLVKPIAIALGANNPVVDDAKREIAGLQARAILRENEIRQLEVSKQQLEANKRALEESKQQLEARKQALEANNQELETSKQQLEARKQALETNKRELEASKQQLEARKQALEANNRELEANKQRLEELNRKLMTSAEIKAANVIQEQLQPATKNYLKHLRIEAMKINPSIVVDAIDALPALDPLDNSFAEYQKIIVKYNAVKQLHDVLNDTINRPLPSERVTAFANKLTTINQQPDFIGHRDPAWQRYSKQCLIALAVLCTGIIPGLVAILGYAKYTGKSPLFFMQSQAQQYSAKVNDMLQQGIAP